MIQNGQEFAEDYWLMEDDKNSNRRVKPRPLRWDFVSDNIGSKLFGVYSKLIELRLKYPSLRSGNMYPFQQEWESQFNDQGYGADVSRGLVLYHRWGNDSAGRLERVIIALNFSSELQTVDIPFPTSGTWIDVLNGDTAINVRDFWFRGWNVNSYWGNIFIQKA